TSSATLSINVVANNSAPVAVNDAYTLAETVPFSVSAPGLLANDSDPDANPLNVILGSGPSHGTLVLNPDGAFVYTPDANYNGADSFTYQAFDGALTSAVATVNLTISAVNDPPVNGIPGGVSTNEDTALVFSAVNGTLISISDADA